MKKEKLFICILNTIISIALTLSIVYTAIQIKVHTIPPYALSSNTLSFSVIKNMYSQQPTLDELELIKQIHNIMSDNNIMLIHDDINNLGLGIYDPEDYYAKFNLVNGEYSLKYNQKNCLLNEESYKYLPINNTHLITPNQNELTISGVYDSDYPLYQVEKSYIYNFFNEPSLEGYFYIDHIDRKHLENTYYDKVYPLLTQNGYIVELYMDYNNSSLDILRSLSANPTYLMSLLLVLYSFINLCLFYFNISTKIKEVIKIHIRLGGTLFYTTKIISLKLFNSILFGGLIGTLIYGLIFNNSNLKLSFGIAIFSIILNSLLSWSLFFGVFLLRVKLYLPQKGDFLHD